MLTADRLRQVLHYDSESGAFSWRIQPNGRVARGRQAGTPNAGRHVKIQVDGRPYLAHRLAWLYVTGTWPSSELDHIDQNGRNNAFTNLRLATRSQNQANRGANKNNCLGLKGASRHRKTGKFQARIHHGGKTIYLGLYETPEAANAAYQAAAERLFGEFGRGR